jgi:hypothetical protein
VPEAPRRPCNHLEFKLQTADACRANGIIRPTDLLDIDSHELFAKHIALAADGFEHHIPRIIEERAKIRMRALGRRGRADWNRTVAEVENHVAYLQLDRAQRMKDLYPHLVQMMRIPDDVIPHTLTFIKPYPERPRQRHELPPTAMSESRDTLFAIPRFNDFNGLQRVRSYINNVTLPNHRAAGGAGADPAILARW